MFKVNNKKTREKYPYSEFFWSVLPQIWTKYGGLNSKSPYSVWMRKNTFQKNLKYGQFLLNDYSFFYFHNRGAM